MVTTGVIGAHWRATVTSWGGIEPHDGSPALQWHIAADDRWHSPEREAAVRQTRVDGTAVVETRVRIPDGDAVQRVWSVPDHGGLTIIEIENASPVAIAVAFTRGDLWSVRPAASPIEGISLPAESVAFPIGHRATLTVALPHRSQGPAPLPSLPTMTSVVQGWTTVTERSGRFVLPDETLSARLTAERCEVALTGAPIGDPVAALIAYGLMARMGQAAADLVPLVAAEIERAGRHADRDWTLGAALDGAATVLSMAGEQRALADLERVRTKLAPTGQLPAEAPSESMRLLAWADRRLVQVRHGGLSLLPDDMPDDWYGLGFEAHRVPTIGADSLSFAVRWHGFRPAVLWDQHGATHRLGSPFAPEWSSTETRGETLWPEQG
jgi:hypothetical protein